MRTSIENQLFVFVANQLITAMPVVILACIVIFQISNFNKTLWLLFGFQLLIYIIAQYRQRKIRKSFSADQFSDHPKPSILDVFKMALIPILQTIFLITVWYAFLLTSEHLSGARLASGVILYGIGLYGFRIIKAFSTFYLLSNQGIWIHFGLDTLYIPYTKISTAYFSKTVQIDAAKLVKSSSSNILGVRNYDFVVLQLRIQSYLIKLWFPELHITPANPNLFLNILKEHM